MVVVMMVIPPITITGGYNDSRAVSPIIAVMMMVVVMVVTLDKELSRSDFRSTLDFIDGLQLFHGIRNRFQQVSIRPDLQHLGRVGRC